MAVLPEYQSLSCLRNESDINGNNNNDNDVVSLWQSVSEKNIEFNQAMLTGSPQRCVVLGKQRTGGKKKQQLRWEFPVDSKMLPAAPTPLEDVSHNLVVPKDVNPVERENEEFPECVLVVFRSGSKNGFEAAASVELWPFSNCGVTPSGCIRSIFVPTTTHGQFFSSGGSVVDLIRNGPSELYICALYVAEAPCPESRGFLESLTPGNANVVRGRVFDFRETWGEGRSAESSGQVFFAGRWQRFKAKSYDEIVACSSAALSVPLPLH